jgi:chitinase
MKAIRFICLLFLLCRASTAISQSPDDSPVVLAYVTSWSDITPDPAYVTHINYAFGHVNETFNGVRVDKPERLKMIAGLKQQKPSLKVLLSIGGWGSGRFSEMAADATYRQAFANDCQRVVKEFNLDGIDIDWEFPTSNMAKISASPEDTDNFTLLMADIRKAIGDGKLLTLASNASAKYIDFKAVNPYLNFVNIMTYDMASPPKHHAALFRSEHTGWSCGDESVKAHIAAGIPAEKLTLGIPFYGHGKSGIDNFIDYKDIIQLQGFTDNWDDIAKAPYLTNAAGEFVCTYENVLSIGIKCQYLLDKKMLGAMYWDYDGDDSNGSLRKAVFEGVMNKIKQ